MPTEPVLVNWIQVVSRRGTTIAHATFTDPSAEGWEIKVIVEDDGEHVGAVRLAFEPDADHADTPHHLDPAVVRNLSLVGLVRTVRDAMAEVEIQEATTAGAAKRAGVLGQPDWWHDPKVTTHGDPWGHPIHGDNRTSNTAAKELDLARLVRRYVELQHEPGPRKRLAEETNYSEHTIKNKLEDARRLGLIEGSARQDGPPLTLTQKAENILSGDQPGTDETGEINDPTSSK